MSIILVHFPAPAPHIPAQPPPTPPSSLAVAPTSESAEENESGRESVGFRNSVRARIERHRSSTPVSPSLAPRARSLRLILRSSFFFCVFRLVLTLCFFASSLPEFRSFTVVPRSVASPSRVGGGTGKAYLRASLAEKAQGGEPPLPLPLPPPLERLPPRPTTRSPPCHST